MKDFLILTVLGVIAVTGLSWAAIYFFIKALPPIKILIVN